MRSRWVQETSRGGPGARGVPSGPPGVDFGSLWAPFWVPFWSNSWYVFLYFFGAILASILDAVLTLFGDHSEVTLETLWCPKFRMKSVTFQRTSPGAPSYHYKVKKLDFCGRVVQNRGSTFSHRGVSGSGFGCQNGAKMDLRIDPKITKDVPRKSIRNSSPKVCQNGAKRSPEVTQNDTKNQPRNSLIF